MQIVKTVDKCQNSKSEAIMNFEHPRVGGGLDP